MLGYPIPKNAIRLYPYLYALIFLGMYSWICPALSASEPTLPKPNRFHLETFPPDAVSPQLKEKLFETTDSLSADTLSAYIHIRSASFAAWDDSSGMLVGSQLGRHPQLYRIAAPRAERQQKTFFNKRMSGFYPNPDAKKKFMIYTEDAEGDEDFRLSHFDFTTRRSHILNNPSGRVDAVLWNDSGTAFAYSHTPKGTDRWDVRIHFAIARDSTQPSSPSAVSYHDSLVLSLPGTWTPMDFSPDSKYLLVQKYISAAEAELHILDLNRGNLIPLFSEKTKLPGVFLDQAIFIPTLPSLPSQLSLPSLSPPKSENSPWLAKCPWSVAFASNHQGEFVRLYLTQPGSDQPPQALSPPADWDVEWSKVNVERNLMIYALNENGQSQLYSLDLKSLKPQTLKPQRLSGIPQGIISGIHFRRPSKARPARQEFAFTLVGPHFRGDVFSYRLDRHALKRWTFSETVGLHKNAFRAPKLVHCPTFDSIPLGGSGVDPAFGTRGTTGATGTIGTAGLVRRKIPAWVYLPKAKKSLHNPPNTPPAPVLILIHGGPEAQARPGFDPFIQYVAGHLGWAIVQPNVRGSSGYGKSWLKADDGYLRMNAVRDIGAVLEWIQTQPNLDASRIAVAGRSYGGFMALSAWIEYGAQTGKTGGIKTGISTVGITHFPTFLQKTSGYRRDLRRVEYGDERDPKMAKFLDSISPLTRLNFLSRDSNLSRPLLLCHGRNDPRVPYSESEAIFKTLQSRSVPAWFLTFEDEGHAFRELDNQIVHSRVMTEFLTRELNR